MTHLKRCRIIVTNDAVVHQVLDGFLPVEHAHAVAALDLEVGLVDFRRVNRLVLILLLWWLLQWIDDWVIFTIDFARHAIDKSTSELLSDRVGPVLGFQVGKQGLIAVLFAVLER